MFTRQSFNLLKLQSVNFTKNIMKLLNGKKKDRYLIEMNFVKPEFQDLFSQTTSGLPTAFQHSPLTTFL